MADSLSLAFLVLLESLPPEQRAAFLLREVFDEPYDRIAEIVGTSEQNARQLAARARRHVEERRPRFQASRDQRQQLATRFSAAAEEGDLGGLEELLAHDVVFRGDGGGKAPAAARAVYGRARVARLLIAGLRALARLGGVTTRRDELNGQPGALFLDLTRTRGNPRLYLAVTCCLAATWLLAPGANAAGTLDQSQTSTPGAGPFPEIQAAQTFTAGLTGALDQIDLHLGQADPPTAGLLVRIYALNGTTLGAASLASATVPLSSVPQPAADWVHVPLSRPRPSPRAPPT